MKRFSFFGAQGEKRNEKEVIPLLHDDELELREAMPAFGRGCVALDITIGKDGVPYVVEIQGTDAGVQGIAEDLEDGEVNPDIKRLSEIWDSTRNRFSNPGWFIEITRDKRLQVPFIPEKNRPETIINGTFDHLFERGKVIVKPHDGYQGKGIRIFDKEHAADARAYASQLTQERSGFVAQAFIESRGAELAPQDLQGNPASMRLVIPFKIINRKASVVVPKFGYQRVAAYHENEVGQKIRGKRVLPEDIGVANRARGAASIPMSEAEYEMGLSVGLEIIENLSKYGESTIEYKKELCQKLSRRTSEVASSIRSKYPVFALHTYEFNDLEKAKADSVFFRFLERELSLIKPDMWEEKRMRRNGKPTIERVQGSSGVAFIELTFSGLQYERKRIPFSLYEAGSLRRVLEEYVRGEKLEALPDSQPAEGGA